MAFDIDEFRIDPGTKLDLAKIDTRGTPFWDPDDKEEGRAKLLELNERLEALQELMWAQGTERLLVSGETVIADEEYLASSITNSWDQVLQGYGKTMPPYNFPEQEVEALVAYLKSLGEDG